jgi:hypothetical protein
MKRQQGLLFVNKKKQKNFVLGGMGAAFSNAHGPEDRKFFSSKKNFFLTSGRFQHA